MKKSLASLFFLFLTTSLFAQKVINKPYFEVKRSSTYTVEKIELYDNETRVHVKGKLFPNWFLRFKKTDFLKDCATGKEYKIIKIEGFNFNEKIYLPESGEKTVVMVFPPLDEGVKKIDYKNAIYGISLEKQRSDINEPKEIPLDVKNWIEKELNKVTETPIKDFNSDGFFNPKKAKLIGYIKGYDTRLNFRTGMVYQGNTITREEYPIVVQVYEDGRFEAELPLIHPEVRYLSINKCYMSYYLEPGQTLAMILDWDDFLTQAIYRHSQTTNYEFKKTVFEGPLAEINTHLMNFTVEKFNYREFKEIVKNQTPTEFREKQDATLITNKNLLAEYVEKNNVNNKTQQLLQNTLLSDYAQVCFDFARMRGFEAKKSTEFNNSKILITDAYYNFLKKIDLNNKGFLVPHSFSTFINRFEFSKPLNIYPKRKPLKINPEITLNQYLEQKNIKITEEDKILQKSLKGKKFKSYKEFQDYQKQFSKNYLDASEAYRLKYFQPLVDKQQNARMKESTMEKWRLRDSVIKNVYQLEKSIVQDMTKIRALKFDIDKSNPENAREYWSALKATINHPFLVSEGERMVNKKYPVIENSVQQSYERQKPEVNSVRDNTTKLPEGKATSIFKNIIDAHKGKILFVDFWATSCGPCVASIKRMKETRSSYKDNPDIDFVFITSNNTSPEKTYLKFIENQELINTYRVSNDDFNYLRQLFKFNGIPQYVVISKNGEVIDNDYKMYRFNDTVDGIIEKHK